MRCTYIDVVVYYSTNLLVRCTSSHIINMRGSRNWGENEIIRFAIWASATTFGLSNYLFVLMVSIRSRSLQYFSNHLVAMLLNMSP